MPIEHIVPTLPGGTGLVPTTATVCLSNVPADVDDTVLCQLVRPYGTVQSAHVLRDDNSSTGRSAVVTMTTDDEAVRVLSAFNGRVLGDCVIQATLSAPHYSNIAATCTRPAANSLMTIQPLLVPTAGGCQTLLLRNAAAAASTPVNSDIMMRQCVTQSYPPQTYELVQLPIM